MPRSRRAPLTTLGVAVLGVAASTMAGFGCAGSRDDGTGGLPGGTATTAAPGFVPATVPPEAEPLVDGLIANLTDGVSLVARVDPARAPCVARRWIGILDPTALLAAGVTSETMSTVRLDEIPDLVPTPLDEVRAQALIESFAACEVDYESVVLASMQASGTVDGEQQACIAAALPDDLLAAVTLSVLLDPELDPALDQQYRDAVEPCVQRASPPTGP